MENLKLTDYQNGLVKEVKGNIVTFNYNDEFVFSIDLSNPSNIKVNKQVNEKVIEAGINYPELLVEDVLLYQMRK